ncbi:MAG: hypothetical protein RLZZ511_1121 [Cyanobacteriota bacterium]|jgi:hypothetical protein
MAFGLAPPQLGAGGRFGRVCIVICLIWCEETALGVF